MSDREQDLSSALVATAKAAFGLIPGVSQALSGYDAYHRSIHDRNVEKMIGHLYDKVEDLEQFISQDWFKSEEGELFIRKTIDAAIDVQSEEKQELFVNVLINGAKTNITIEQKTKFVDMLRQLSLASIQVLAEMHSMFASRTRRPGKQNDESEGIPNIDPNKIAEELSIKYAPYLITSAIKELESHGLFSNIGEWHKAGDRYRPGRGFATNLAYTDFSASFAEFISYDQAKSIE